MDLTIVLENGDVISESDLERAEKAVFLSIKKELPEEVLFQETINIVLDRCKQSLKYKKIIL